MPPHPSHLHNLPLAAAADGKPDAAILASSGGKDDPREFYCTTYRSRHNAATTALSPRDNALNTQFRWPRDAHVGMKSAENASASSLAARAAALSPRSGFARGVGPAFDYDPAVDERDSAFAGVRAANIETATHAHFPSPQAASAAAELGSTPASPTTHGVATRDDVRLHSSPYPSVRAVPGVFLSTMKASYVPPPPPHVKTSRGPSSPSSPRGDSAWTHDIEHRIIGNAELLHASPRAKTAAAAAPQPTSVAPPISYVDTGYSRISRSSSPLSLAAADAAHAPAQPNTQSPLRAPQSPSKSSAWVAENTPRERLLAAMARRTYDTSYSVAYDGARQPRQAHLPVSPQSPKSPLSAQLPLSPPPPLAASAADSRRGLALRVDTGALRREGEYRPSPVVAPASRSGYSLCNKFEFEPIDAASPLAPGNEAPTDVQMLQLRRERDNKSLTTRI